VQSQLAGLQAVKTAAAEAAAAPRNGKPRPTTELVVEGRAVPCPICGHDRFRTRTTVMASGLLAAFDMEWAGSEALNYVCDRCGHVLWFMR
jgi:DNA-directed RNA polymerase subunit RPC12/RpoP